MKAILALEDGTIVEGVSAGAPGEVAGEIVFNTAVVGFQEMLTDPASRGQILLFTYPLIGNYGVCEADMESGTLQATGLVIKDLSTVTSNFRAQGSFADFMKKHNLVCISQMDTRGLAVHLRDHGEMKAVISTQDANPNSLIQKAKAARKAGAEAVQQVSAARKRTFEPESGQAKQTVGVLDLGIRKSEIRQLQAAGCRVVIFPVNTPGDELTADGIGRLLLSGGPSAVLPPEEVTQKVAKLLGKLPVFGTGLGHNVLAAALGCPSVRMKLGHRGVNQPVRTLATRHVEITVQNHGVVVDRQAAEANQGVEITHDQINDHTVEGIRSRNQPAFSVQYSLPVVEKSDVHSHLAEFLRI